MGRARVESADLPLAPKDTSDYRLVQHLPLFGGNAQMQAIRSNDARSGAETATFRATRSHHVRSTSSMSRA